MAANIVTTTPSRNDLNNDCLRENFLYIEVKERMKLRTVCKAWCNAVDDCWRDVRAVTIINTETTRAAVIKNEITGTNKRIRITEPGSRYKLSSGVMERCGDVIADFHQENTNFGLRLAARHCSKIEKLVATVRTELDDENVSQVFAMNPKLRIIDLEIELKNAKLCFSKMPTDSLERLAFKVHHKSVWEKVVVGIEFVIRRSSSLKELSIYGYDDEVLELIGEKTTLESLQFTRSIITFRVSEIGLNALLNLKNLRKLQFQTLVTLGEHISDDFLMAVSENLPLLEVIVMEWPSYVTDEGFKSLATLVNLRELTITKCQLITDKYLLLFAGLDKFNVSYCTVSDEGAVKLIEKAVTMRYFNLKGTLITSATVAAAVKATKKRSNGILLELHTSAFTPGGPNTMAETSPLLELFVSYSVCRYRD